MGRSFAILIWLITALTIGFFAWAKAKTGWWFPQAISTHAGAMDSQFNLTWTIIGVGFFLAQAALGIAVWRFRAKGDGNRRATHNESSSRIEITLTAITAVVFIFLAITGQRVWANLHLNQAPPDAVQIEVTAQQFQWYFRYPGADGRYGTTSPKLYNDADNSVGARPGPLGIDAGDPSGTDDIVSGLMVVPVNRPINVTLRAKDVTHDFFVPVLRLKQDAVPGLKINIHFTVTKEGRYEIACAELCGQLHHQMRAYLEVKSQVEFEKWLSEKAPK